MIAKLSQPNVIACFEKEVYGNIHIYCSDAEQAKLLSKLTGKKTLNHQDLEALKGLGFGINLQKLPTRN